MKPFKSFKNNRIAIILLLVLCAEQISACFWKILCNTPCATQHKYNTHQITVQHQYVGNHNAVWNQQHYNLRHQTPLYIRSPSYLNSNQYPSSYKIPLKPINQISLYNRFPPNNYITPNVRITTHDTKTDSRYNFVPTIPAVTSRTYSTPNYIENKQYTTTTTNHPFISKTFSILNHVVNQISTIPNQIFPQVEKTLNESKHVSENIYEHVEKNIKTALTSVTNALKNVANYGYQQEDKPLREHDIVNKEEILKSILNAVKDFILHLGISHHDMIDKPKCNGEHNSETEKVLESIIHAFNNVTLQHPKFKDEEKYLESLINAIKDVMSLIKNTSETPESNCKHSSAFKEAVISLINALKDITSTIHNQVITDDEKILNGFNHNVKANGKHDVAAEEKYLTEIKNALKDIRVTSATHNQVIPEDGKILNGLNHNVKNNGKHDVASEEKYLTAIKNALKNKTSTIHNQIIPLDLKTLNESKHESEKNSEHFDNSFKTALTSVINAIKNVATYEYGYQQENKPLREHDIASKEVILKSILNAVKDFILHLGISHHDMIDKPKCNGEHNSETEKVLESIIHAFNNVTLQHPKFKDEEKYLESLINAIKDVMSLIKNTSEKPESNCKHSSAFKEAVKSLFNALKDITSTIHNRVIPGVEKDNGKHDVASEEKYLTEIKNAIKDIRVTSTIHNQVITDNKKILNGFNHNVKSNGKHDVAAEEKYLTAIKNALKSKTSTIHKQFEPKVEETFSASKHEDVNNVAALNETALKTVIHAIKEVITDFSQQKPKCNCKHDSETKEEAVISILNTIKDFQFLDAAAKYEAVKSILNTIKDFKSYVVTKENAMKSIINTITNFKYHVPQQHMPKSKHDADTREEAEAVKSILTTLKNFKTLDAASKEKAVKSILKTIKDSKSLNEFNMNLIINTLKNIISTSHNRVIPLVSPTQTVSRTGQNVNESTNQNASNHFVYNTQNATDDNQHNFVPLENEDEHKKFEWINDVPAMR